MKSRLLLIVLLFCAPKTTLADVQLGSVSPNFAYVDDNPFATLVAALRCDGHSTRFRVSWWNTLGSGWDRGSLVFDRTKHTLAYYNVGGAGEAGEEFYRRRAVFLRVQETPFLKLVAQFNTPSAVRRFLPAKFLTVFPARGFPALYVENFQRGLPSPTTP